ncbi:MAG: hypothetical protein HYW25_04410 [Candidatus Aenigmarchaeota archaeon]|nr:hypothetical protein [Candidatus Aenigmarchaeota archaeon]
MKNYAILKLGLSKGSVYLACIQDGESDGEFGSMANRFATAIDAEIIYRGRGAPEVVREIIENANAGGSISKITEREIVLLR